MVLIEEEFNQLICSYRSLVDKIKEYQEGHTSLNKFKQISYDHMHVSKTLTERIEELCGEEHDFAGNLKSLNQYHQNLIHIALEKNDRKKLAELRYHLMELSEIS